jgi:hypothetical protein
MTQMRTHTHTLELSTASGLNNVLLRTTQCVNESVAATADLSMAFGKSFTIPSDTPPAPETIRPPSRPLQPVSDPSFDAIPLLLTWRRV